MAGSMVYRLRVAELNAPHMDRFREALGTLKSFSDNRGYHHIAGFHGAPGQYCWHHQASRRTSSSARLFLPWHRAYLYHLEQALQDIDIDVALPWWDWTVQQEIPTAFDTAQVDGQKNPLHSTDVDLTPPQVGTAIQRHTTRNPSPDIPVFSFPEADANQDGIASLGELVRFLVERVTDFESFNDVLENIHDAMHGWVGGDMASVTTAAYDPIFFAHHAMIDRVWYLWQVRNGVERFPPQLLDLPLPPFGMSVRDVLNVQDLGYEYALQTTDIPGEDDA